MSVAARVPGQVGRGSKVHWLLPVTSVVPAWAKGLERPTFTPICALKSGRVHGPGARFVLIAPLPAGTPVTCATCLSFDVKLEARAEKRTELRAKRELQKVADEKLAAEFRAARLAREGGRS